MLDNVERRTSIAPGRVRVCGEQKKVERTMSRRDPREADPVATPDASSDAVEVSPRVVLYDPERHFPHLGFLFEALSPEDAARVTRDLRPLQEGEVRPPTAVEPESGFEAIDATSRLWVYLDEHTGKPVGIVGCYQTTEDRHEAIWGDYLAIDDSAPRLTVLPALLRRLWIHIAETGPYRYFRLWSGPPLTLGEKVADRLYRRLGMEVYRRYPSPDPDYPYEIWLYQIEIEKLRFLGGHRH